MRLFGLIGYPLVQSFSQRFFTEKFRQLGLADCFFQNFPITAIEEFPGLLQQYPELEGVAVTIPYKQVVLPYLNNTTNIPQGLNACNCIRIKSNQLTGFNTDYIGFEKSFTPLLQPHHQRALILGNGGSTAAVAFVLEKYNIGFKIVSRQSHDGSALAYADIDKQTLAEHPVIINTTPLGMFPNVDACPDIPYQWLTQDNYLYDLVYNPAKTLFLQKGEERGAIIKNGADMLEIQAEENWRIWNYGR